MGWKLERGTRDHDYKFFPPGIDEENGIFRVTYVDSIKKLCWLIQCQTGYERWDGACSREWEAVIDAVENYMNGRR